MAPVSQSQMVLEDIGNKRNRLTTSGAGFAEEVWRKGQTDKHTDNGSEASGAFSSCTSPSCWYVWLFYNKKCVCVCKRENRNDSQVVYGCVYGN